MTSVMVEWQPDGTAESPTEARPAEQVSRAPAKGRLSRQRARGSDIQPRGPAGGGRSSRITRRENRGGSHRDDAASADVGQGAPALVAVDGGGDRRASGAVHGSRPDGPRAVCELEQSKRCTSGGESWARRRRTCTTPSPRCAASWRSCSGRRVRRRTSASWRSWSAISAAIRPALQAIPEPTERPPAEYFANWHRRGCCAGYGSRGGTSRGEGSGSRYLKAVCEHPGCGYQVRITRRWLALGAPLCPVAGHGSLEPQD